MKTICITKADDGAFSVYEEQPEGTEPATAMPGADPAAEIPAVEMGAESAPAQVASIDEALEMARQMLQDDGRSQEQAVMDGYLKSKPAMAAKPTPQAVFGEGL